MATTIVAALVLASLSLTAAYAWSGGRRHDHGLTTKVFTMTSTIYTTPSGVYPTSSCSGSPALLYPGVTRCVVFNVRNNLSQPITVQTITTALDAKYPAPPAVCSGSNLTLPTFSGAFTVAGGATGNSPGVPIVLKESGTNQDACEHFTYHFVYSGSAQYTDATSTVLTSSPNPSVLGKPVTFTAVVTAANAGSDSSLPSGLVSFYTCPTVACASTTPLGTGNIGTGGRATYTTSSLHVGTTYVEAVYPGATTTFVGSTSNVVTQVIASSLIATSTLLTSSPNPSVLGNSVALVAKVISPSGSDTPSGSVSFYLGTPTGIHTLLGASTLLSGGANLVTSSLPQGTDSLYAVYGGDLKFITSTSPIISQLVVVRLRACRESYNNWFFGSPGSPSVHGTSGNDYFYGFGGSYQFHGQDGDDCLDAGDGNNWFAAGNGNDVVHCGNGNNIITLGNGNDDIVLGDGSNDVTVGNGDVTVTVGNGEHNHVFFGNGQDSVTLGTGSYNNVVLGSGTDTINVLGGGRDSISGGNGNETIYFGAGLNNTYEGAAHRANVCHLPTPPSSWHGTAAAYYHDTVINCTVVTP